jgi:hypothetical protein
MNDFKDIILDKLQFDILDLEDINKPNKNGIYLIYAILNSDHPDLLAVAIKNGLNINRDLGEGWTPIHQAIDNAIDGMIQDNLDLPDPETLELIKILIDNGASLDVCDKKGYKPLDALNTYSANIDTFNHLKNVLRTSIPSIDDKVMFDKNKTT